MKPAAAPQDDDTKTWFNAEGWKLPYMELEKQLQDRGCDDDTIVDYQDQAADRKRAAAKDPVAATLPVSQPARHLHPVSETGPVPPQNLEAEESVLGAMLLSPAAIGIVSEILAPQDFYYQETHGTIYEAAIALDAAGSPVDVITLTDELKRRGQLDKVGGQIKLVELAQLVTATAAVAHHARIVKEVATVRGVIRAGTEIARIGWERDGDAAQLVDRAQQVALTLGDTASSDQTEHVGGPLQETFRRMQERAESGKHMVGVPSGLRTLDSLTAGFEPGNLIILAARPSMGKSALAHAFVAHLAVRERLPVGLFTPEMSKGEVANRLLAREAHVDAKKLREAHRLDPGEWARLAKAAGQLEQAPIHVNDKGDLTLATVRSVARRLKQRNPDLALLVVDYLQLMSGDGENRTQEVSKLSRGLKILARDLNVPIIALSQLSRAVEQRHDKRPILSDLRESGSIEQDADLVMFLYRDDYYNPETEAPGIAELIVAKHRNGPTDTLKLAFVKREATFTDLHTPGVYA